MVVLATSKQSEQILRSSFLGALNDDVIDFGKVSHCGKGEHLQQQYKHFCPFALNAEWIIRAICQLDVRVVLYLSEAIESESYLVIASGVGGVSLLLSVKPLPSITGGLMLRERDFLQTRRVRYAAEVCVKRYSNDVLDTSKA